MSANNTNSGDNVTKVEFAVQMTCNSCKEKIGEELKKLKDIKVLDIDVDKQKVLVELRQTSSSVHEIQSTIESKLGLKAVIKGLGDSIAGVSEIFGQDNIVGVVRFTQLLNNLCLVDGVIDGIGHQNQYSLNIHESGDLSGQSFEYLGRVYKPVIAQLAANDSLHSSRAVFKTQVSNCDLSSIIGRALAVSLQDLVIGAGVVARASSVGDNTKKICACSGRTLWDERAIKQEDSTSRL